MLLAAHSGTRYLVLLIGFVTLAYAVYGLATKRSYDGTISKLASAFAGLIHLQILLGVGVLFSGRFGAYLIGHIFMVLAGAAVAQAIPSVMRRRPAEERTWAPHVIGTLLALALIAGGIMAIPGRGVFQSTI